MLESCLPLVIMTLLLHIGAQPGVIEVRTTHRAEKVSRIRVSFKSDFLRSVVGERTDLSSVCIAAFTYNDATRAYEHIRHFDFIPEIVQVRSSGIVGHLYIPRKYMGRRTIYIRVALAPRLLLPLFGHNSHHWVAIRIKARNSSIEIENRPTQYLNLLSKGIVRILNSPADMESLKETIRSKLDAGSGSCIQKNGSLRNGYCKECLVAGGLAFQCFLGRVNEILHRKEQWRDERKTEVLSLMHSYLKQRRDGSPIRLGEEVHCGAEEKGPLISSIRHELNCIKTSMGKDKVDGYIDLAERLHFLHYIRPFISRKSYFEAPEWEEEMYDVVLNIPQEYISAMLDKDATFGGKTVMKHASGPSLENTSLLETYLRNEEYASVRVCEELGVVTLKIRTCTYDKIMEYEEKWVELCYRTEYGTKRRMRYLL
jgi:hypothetical protein